MAHMLAAVNVAQTFLSGFSGKIFIRLLHAGYDPSTQEPKRLRPRQCYGDVATISEWLEATAVPLNSGSTEDLKFNVFYSAGDPGQGAHCQQDDIGEIRLLYQDSDEPERAVIDQMIAGQLAHFVVETSPGKRQRIWHTESVDVHRHRAIHDHMVARHAHDHSTHGPHRLLRLPGFRNWKYPDGPVAEIVSDRSHLPRLTQDAIQTHFGFRAADASASNLEAAAGRIQASGDMPEATVYSLDRERAKRSGSRDTSAETQNRHRDAHDLKTAQLSASEVLDALALIEADNHRNEWRRVLAALHFMTGDAEWGRAFAEVWSMTAPHRFDEAAFNREWAGLKRDVAFPSSWFTILRITANLEHDDRSRAIRHGVAFKRLEEEFGPVLDYEPFEVRYPVSVKVDTPDGPIFRPDPGERRNIQYLLEIEGLRVWRDVFAQADMIADGGRAWEIDNQTITRLYSTAHSTKLRVTKAFLADQVEGIAADTQRDAVLDYFNRLPPWDGKERLNTLFQRHLGAPDSPSIRELGEIILCAIVRRTFKPGFKFDLLPILEGKQEKGKSSLFRLLMPDETMFGEGPKMNEEPKRLLAQLTGKLIVEFAELAGNSKQNVDSIKKLITQQVDEYTPNYARKPVKVPRRCIFVGTVNGSQYLRDLTDNRRFPIIPVTRELQYHELLAERDQLWAEALLTEPLLGELRLSPEAVADMKEIQEERLDIHSETSAFMYEIRQYDAGWLTEETVWERIGIPFDQRWKRTGQMQYLRNEIKTLMERDGWEWNKQLKVDGKNRRVIFKRDKRGTPTQIICNNGTLGSIDEIDIEELLK